MFSTVAFYLHTELVLTNRRLYAVRPSVMFGLLPVGTSRSNFPVENIAGVNASTKFDVLGVVFGLAGVLFGLVAAAIPGVGILGVFLILLGIASIIAAPKQSIEVMNSGGGLIPFRVSVLERGKTLEFANRVAEAIARNSKDGTSTNPAIASNTDRLDAGAALRHLMDLQQQGLITEDEYTVKRGEILGRL